MVVLKQRLWENSNLIASSLTIDGIAKRHHAIVIGQYSDCVKSGLILIAILTLLPY